MEWNLVDLILHLDKHLIQLTTHYGAWVYLILFAIIFCETGLVVMPFLPGDSLLFAVGTLCALGELNPHLAFLLLASAAILGDSLNYALGYYLGDKAFHQGNARFFKKEHLDRTHRFYEKYGAKTIVLARFVPIVRTFAPFVAGVGQMTYAKFLFYNVIGGLAWVALLVYTGYFFGNLPIVKNNFSLVILAIIVISLLPIAFEWLRQNKTPESR